jgi:hypothetical protein
LLPFSRLSHNASGLPGQPATASIPDVREALGKGFPPGPIPQLFYGADEEPGEIHVDFEEADFLTVFP